MVFDAISVKLGHVFTSGEDEKVRKIPEKPDLN
jgi:hypothetical protein